MEHIDYTPSDLEAVKTLKVGRKYKTADGFIVECVDAEEQPRCGVCAFEHDALMCYNMPCGHRDCYYRVKGE